MTLTVDPDAMVAAARRLERNDIKPIGRYSYTGGHTYGYGVLVWAVDQFIATLDNSLGHAASDLERLESGLRTAAEYLADAELSAVEEILLVAGWSRI
ncbi:MAG: hypothetical protein FWE61_00775 [Micrococcales bacterium]|nr:hypothetical protein [Micrococcales bacterium]